MDITEVELITFQIDLNYFIAINNNAIDKLELSKVEVIQIQNQHVQENLLRNLLNLLNLSQNVLRLNEINKNKYAHFISVTKSFHNYYPRSITQYNKKKCKY